MCCFFPTRNGAEVSCSEKTRPACSYQQFGKGTQFPAVCHFEIFIFRAAVNAVTVSTLVWHQNVAPMLKTPACVLLMGLILNSSVLPGLLELGGELPRWVYHALPAATGRYGRYALNEGLVPWVFWFSLLENYFCHFRFFFFFFLMFWFI